MIAGIIQGNVRQSPYVNPDGGAAAAQLRARAHGRRGLHHAARPPTAPRRSRSSRAASRRSDVASRRTSSRRSASTSRARYGAKALYESGLTVRTPLDAELQRAANRALDAGLRRVDKRRTRLPAQAAAQRARRGRTRSTAYRHERWARPIAAGDIVPALVERVDAAGDRAGHAARAHRHATRRAHPRRLSSGRGARTPRSSSRVGDLIEVELADASTTGAARRRCTLEQTPLLEGALVAHRQPHRPGPGDGRRLQLRAQQVQPRHAGAAGSSARRSSRSSTPPPSTAASRRRRCSIDAPASFDAGAGPAAVRAAELRPQVRRAGHAARARSSSRATSRPCKVMEMLGPRAGRAPTPSASASRATFPPYPVARRSAPPRRRCSR